MNTTFGKITATALIVLVAMLLNPSILSAQHESHKGGQQVNPHGMKQEKIEAHRVAFITQKLNLTPAEAKVFWPVYDEYDAKRHELRKSYRTKEDLRSEEIEKLTEKEASAILENQIAESQKHMDLRKEYIKKFQSVLPSSKVLMLQNAEREFQKMLIDKLRQNKPKQAPVKK